MIAPELVSIELSRRCQKGCHFCYNGSTPTATDAWAPDDVIAFVDSLAAHGTRSVSLGGGEPLEYPFLDTVFEALRDKVFLTMTSNGLLLDEQLARVSQLNPAKMHISIHFPHNHREVERVIRQVKSLRMLGIRAGVNLLVRRDRLAAAQRAAESVRAAGIRNDAIVYLPMRGAQTPTPQQMATVAGATKFQSMTCLLQCGKSPRFASVDANAYAAHCSFTTERRRLETLDAPGLAAALAGLGITFCGGTSTGSTGSGN